MYFVLRNMKSICLKISVFELWINNAFFYSNYFKCNTIDIIKEKKKVKNKNVSLQ